MFSRNIAYRIQFTTDALCKVCICTIMIKFNSVALRWPKRNHSSPAALDFYGCPLLPSFLLSSLGFGADVIEVVHALYQAR